MSLEYFVGWFIKERKYDVLAWILVSEMDALVEVLRKASPNTKEETLWKVAKRLKELVLDRLSDPLLNVCPYCLSKRVENWDFEYECLDCGKRFVVGWKDERFLEVASAIYHYLRERGISDEEVKRYLFDVFGLILKDVKRVPYRSREEVSSLVENTLKLTYDDPVIRKKYFDYVGITEDVEREKHEKVVEKSKVEVRKVDLNQVLGSRVELSEEDKLVLEALKKHGAMCYSEICRVTGLSYNRVRTAVKWLERFGFVKVVRYNVSKVVIPLPS